MSALSHAPLSADIAWSFQQNVALDAIEDWLARCGDTPFYLAGYAGTGKTTLAREIGQRAGHAVFAAFTGKAADVMRRKGCANATTIDSLIYIPQLETSCAAAPPCVVIESCPAMRDGNRCQHRRKRFVGRTLNGLSEVADADLVVIDEVSMVGARMGRDLLSFGVPVLALGDEAQLPPVMGTGFFTNRPPDFQLTEIHRQALGSPIIRLATMAREGRPLPCGQYGDSRVRSHCDVDVDTMLAHDQIICGTHRMRHRVNAMIRHKLGFNGDTPAVGEKLLCLRNDKQLGLHNGTLWTVTKSGLPRRGFVQLEIEDDTQHRVAVEAPVDGFTSRDGNGSDLPGQPFAYGYAITCHKSQGSQWGSVLVVDESEVFRADRWRWLYTAITRAADRVTVVQP
jgi:exodeoxyribonuclease-5